MVPTAGQPLCDPGEWFVGWPPRGSPEHVERGRLHHEAGHGAAFSRPLRVGSIGAAWPPTGGTEWEE